MGIASEAAYRRVKIARQSGGGFNGKEGSLTARKIQSPDSPKKDGCLFCLFCQACCEISLAREIAHNSTTIAHESRNNLPADRRKGLSEWQIGRAANIGRARRGGSVGGSAGWLGGPIRYPGVMRGVRWGESRGIHKVFLAKCAGKPR